MSQQLGSLVVSLALETAKFNEGMQAAAAKAGDFAGKMAQVGAAGAAAFAAVGAAVLPMVKASIDAADAASKLAQSAGVSVESLTSLGYAAEMSGLNTEQFAGALTKLSRQIADAASGTGAAAEAFAAMGVSVTDANGGLRASDQVLADVAAKFATYEDGAAKSALAVELFGKSGAQMIPLLNSGADGLAEMQAEAEALGLVLGTDAAKSAEAFNDNLTRLAKVQEGFVNRIAQELVPTLDALTTRLFESARSSGAFEQAARAAAAGVRILLSAGAIIVGVFQAVGQALGGVAATLVALFSGRFRDAFETYKSYVTDFAGNIKGIAGTVSAIWDDTAGKVAASAPANGARIAAPMVRAANEAKRAGQSLKTEVDRAQQAIAQALAGLETEAAKLGMSGSQARLFDLAAMGASPEQLETARRLLDQIDAYNARVEAAAEAQERANSVAQEGQRIYESTRTPVEQLNAEYARLKDLLDAGVISWDTYGRAVMMAQDAFDQATEAAKKTGTEMDEFAKNAAQNIQRSLGDTFVNIMEGNFSSVGQAFTQMLNRMVAEAAAAQLARHLFGSMVEGGSGSGMFGDLLSSFASSIFGGRAMGGPVSPHTPYLVGEHGPELFVPSTAGSVQSNGSMRGMTVVNNFTIQGNVDKRTQLQIAREANMALQRGQRNM